uniref:Uncharacterized protein n=1 Tax=Rhizophora mucronata TaxID=61149 RepID=A0A2P2QXQ8_RHIMU
MPVIFLSKRKENSPSIQC